MLRTAVALHVAFEVNAARPREVGNFHAQRVCAAHEVADALREVVNQMVPLATITAGYPMAEVVRDELDSIERNRRDLLVVACFDIQVRVGRCLRAEREVDGVLMKLRTVHTEPPSARSRAVPARTVVVQVTVANRGRQSIVPLLPVRCHACGDVFVNHDRHLESSERLRAFLEPRGN